MLPSFVKVISTYFDRSVQYNILQQEHSIACYNNKSRQGDLLPVEGRKAENSWKKLVKSKSGDFVSKLQGTEITMTVLQTTKTKF